MNKRNFCEQSRKLTRIKFRRDFLFNLLLHCPKKLVVASSEMILLSVIKDQCLLKNLVNRDNFLKYFFDT